MTIVTQDPQSHSPVLVREGFGVSTAERIAVWSGVLGLSALVWSAAFSGLGGLLG